MSNNEERTSIRLSPSQFMRDLRPEYYSDSTQNEGYILEKPVFAYHLDTVTQRNQTHDFEVFCRKLCERAICPNLRAQTGPDGGGDSKADSETFPVSDEISGLFYIGEANSGRERWAFAFSAKEKWKEKVKSDVKGIISTGRPYDRIIFVTSRLAKAKDRAKLEDDLTNEFGVPVTIHDQTWIIEEIIDKGRKDIAFNYLHIGSINLEAKLGPTDYSRQQQLDEIEAQLANPDAFEGMEDQKVIDALVAAKLSRNLEKPRFETEGRFARAIKLADEFGNYRQKLEAKYEHLWTGVWWFDDEQQLLNSYDAFEALVIETDYMKDMEFLCNLLQLLYNGVIHKNIRLEDGLLDTRTEKVSSALKRMAADTSRPNNSIEAEVRLTILELNKTILNGNRENFSDIWNKYSELIDKAEGLGEFEAQRFAQLIEGAGNLAGNDSGYNALVEKLADFISRRESEVVGAKILLRRASQLDLSAHFEMIRLLGKAMLSLSKKECAEELIDAGIQLMIAYRSAGLIWASRSICIFVAATIVIEGEEAGEISPRFIKVMEFWAWTSFDLRNIPDFLMGIQLINGTAAAKPLSDETLLKVKNHLQELDMILGALFLNMSEDDLKRFENIPDLLDGLGLFMARSALLYISGYEKELREEGAIPASENPEMALDLMTNLCAWPAAQFDSQPLILKDGAPHILVTQIMGMSIEVHGLDDANMISSAEIILGSLEAFFATALEFRAMPHVEKLKIQMVILPDLISPSFEIDPLQKVSIIRWPPLYNPSEYKNQGSFQEFLVGMAGKIFLSTCYVDGIENFFQKLFEDENVYKRVALTASSGNSYHRVFGKGFVQLSDWRQHLKTNYPISSDRDRPVLSREKIEDLLKERREAIDLFDPDEPDTFFNNHKEVKIKSIINISAWDAARWRGVLYGYGGVELPFMGLIFEDYDAGCRIFEEWKERFGQVDKDEEINISILKNIERNNPYFYKVTFTSSVPLTAKNINQKYLIASRAKIMEPSNGINLNNFIAAFERSGGYYIMPAGIDSSGRPVFGQSIKILKRQLIVEDADFQEDANFFVPGTRTGKI